MRASFAAAVASFALIAGGCDGQEATGNETAPAGQAPTASIPAPNGGDWTEVVSETAEGGYLMGNPDAPVKVVEFASMTCPHCGEFAEVGLPQLEERYIRTGQVNFEFRNFVRDPADLAASLLARCSGPGPFFQLTDQLFGAQNEWIGQLQQMTQEQQQQLQTLQPQQAVALMAQQAGLVDFVRLRGIPAEKAQSCLADQQAMQRLVTMQQQAVQRHQIQGTPSFLVNGELAENASNWAALEKQIQEALR